MINVIKADGFNEKEFLSEVRQRQFDTDKKVTSTVSQIIQDVKDNGDKAVDRYTREFDGQLPPYREVPQEVIQDALTEADEGFVSALLNAVENISAFHTKQVEQSFVDTQPDGVILGQRIRGLDSVGLYVPGGTAAYPSSVLMNAIPAKIAGVRQLVMITPPGKDGKPNRDILTAAAICGVDRIFLAGGAQAVAALAYGTETMPKVDKIVGPGNIYVATAKKLLYGVVDIDMIAGPSEILVLADDSAKDFGSYIAADLMSQAEHDPIASAILVTTSQAVADNTVEALKSQINNMSRKDIITSSLGKYGAIIVCDTMEDGIELANQLAPEHLEVLCENPMEYVGKLHNAGSIFLGPYSPEPLGDYYAGPNHVLPTGGTARFFSPLSVTSFTKRSSFIYYTKEALFRAKSDIVTIAEKEMLTAHANAIKVRFQ